MDVASCDGLKRRLFPAPCCTVCVLCSSNLEFVIVVSIVYCETPNMFGPKKYFGWTGRSLNLAISSLGSLDFLYVLPQTFCPLIAPCFVPSCGSRHTTTSLTALSRLFGYDQGITGGLLDLPSFTKYFPEINPDDPLIDGHGDLKSQRALNQGIAVAAYNLGCFIGAIITVFIGNPLGRRRTIMLGCSTMATGALLQSTAFSLPHFIIGRIVTGIGNGINTSTVPTWQSESAKSSDRGKLVMIEGALITGGICLSYWINYGKSHLPRIFRSTRDPDG